MYHPEIFLLAKENLTLEGIRQYYVSFETNEEMMDNLVEIMKNLEPIVKSGKLIKSFCIYHLH